METLKSSSQFERVRRNGRSWSSGPVVLNAAPNGLPDIRLGFIVGKKVGNAVKRNRARRLMREAIRLRLPLMQPGWDLVLIARSSICEADAATVSAAVEQLLNRGKLFGHVISATEIAQSRIIDGDRDTSPSSEPQARPLPGEGKQPVSETGQS